MNAFGLDLSFTSIRAVSLKKEGAAFSLDAVGIKPINAKVLQSESAVDQQVLADTIKKLLVDAQIRSTEVNIALPESQVYAKIIEMPDLSEQELAAALRWEMEQYIPMPIEQVQTDWQILSKKQVEGKKLMDVLLVAAPLLIIQKYENILSLSGLEVHGIETKMIAAHRALLPLLTTQNTSMIVHLGSATTDIAIVKNGMLKMIFSIGLGGLAITRAISIDLGIDLNQAEEYKRAYGLNDQAFEGKIGKSLSPILESIASDIKKAMFSYREKNQNDEIKQIVLSGSNAFLPGLDVYFTNTLNSQVVMGNSWKAHSISNVPEQLVNDSTSFDVVVGLALRDLT